jgi:hypothetical protein
LILVSLALARYWYVERQYTQNARHFEASFRQTIDPEALRQWADIFMRQHPESYGEYEVTNATVSLSGLPPDLSDVIIDRRDDERCLILYWGRTLPSIVIGPTNHVEPTNFLVSMWKDGIYICQPRKQ